MKIIVDAFGGDNAPLEILRGCAQAIAEYDIDILLVGPKDKIELAAQKGNVLMYHMEIHDAPDIISMEDDPAEIVKSKSRSSMAIGLKLLADGHGDAFVSAGNSGALVMGATFIVKRIHGIKRCAFAPVIPKSSGCFMLLDSGANIECRPEMLLQFGVMGSIYMEKVMNIKNPRVGLVNVGTEEHKGGPLQLKAFEELNDSELNFIGNIEAREIPIDGADVVVTDGFTGNVILKLYEGMALTLMDKVKSVFRENAKTKLAGGLVMKEMREMSKTIDYNEYGGAPIIGITKPVFKAHGGSDARTFKNALRLTLEYVEANVVDEIATAVALPRPAPLQD